MYIYNYLSLSIYIYIYNSIIYYNMLPWQPQEPGPESPGGDGAYIYIYIYIEQLFISICIVVYHVY